MIHLRDVEKSYKTGGGRTWVLRRITLDIAEGDFVTFMGPSGAGKSTLLAILGMLDADWPGEYQLFDQAVHKLPPKERVALNKKHVGFVFQQFHLLDDLTVAENLEVPLSYRDLPGSERKARVADALDRFQIVGKKDLYPSQLSGGQQQLVAVARAVIAKPAAAAGRRADRQPAHHAGRGDHGAVLRAEPPGHHHRPGHPLGEERRPRQAHHPAQGRLAGA